MTDVLIELLNVLSEISEQSKNTNVVVEMKLHFYIKIKIVTNSLFSDNQLITEKKIVFDNTNEIKKFQNFLCREYLKQTF